FFFSSRRRHTRSKRDWSSDVCSSDLYDTLDTYSQANLDASDDWAEQTTPDTILVALTPEEVDTLYYYQSKSGVTFYVTVPQRNEIGRASCRDRLCDSNEVVVVRIKGT